jgi:hypothetical protein
MQADRSVLIGAPSDIINSTSLAATYGIEVGVFSIPRAPPRQSLTFCSPW